MGLSDYIFCRARQLRTLPLLALCFLLSCHSRQEVHTAQFKNMKLVADSVGAPDQRIVTIIQPYKQRLDSLMNVEINTADVEMKKELPEGSLGNMVCDVLMDYVNRRNTQADLCIMNHGGLRIPVLYQGPVYVRTIFELMPFENQLLVLEMKGSSCKKITDAIAKYGGAPVSGLRMKIAGDTASDVLIGSAPIDADKTYRVLTSDYLANGGDNSDAMKEALQVIDLNIKIRDALIIQIKQMKADGKTLTGAKDGRITKY